MAKYGIAESSGLEDVQDILVDGEPIGEIELLTGELNRARLEDLISHANRALERPRRVVPQPTATPMPAELPSGLTNDIDDSDAANFLVKHHVPFIGPDMGAELIKIVKRLEVVRSVYPLPPTVEAYRLSLHLMLQVAARHQDLFCTQMERIMVEDAQAAG